MLDTIENDARSGITLFALEGGSGTGKSTLLSEISARLAVLGFVGSANLNAAHLTSEKQAIANLYEQLRHLPRDLEALAHSLVERFNREAFQHARKLITAVLADTVKLAADKYEKTIEVGREILAGKDATPSVAAQLEVARRENLRYFVDYFLDTLVRAQNSVVICIDNFDSADVTVVSLVRFLLSIKRVGVAIVLAHNTERSSKSDWNVILADVRAGGGRVYLVEPLSRAAIAAWFEHERNRAPTGEELETLERVTHGRAHDLTLLFEATKNGNEIPPQRDYKGYYELAREQLAPNAWSVAGLLAVVCRDALVHRDLLAIAAEALGVDNFNIAFDQLRIHRQLRIEGKFVSLVHALAQESWLETIDAPFEQRLMNAWFTSMQKLNPSQLAGLGAVGLIPFVAKPLLNTKSVAEIAEISKQLIALGQMGMALILLDPAWKFESSAHNGGADMLESAMLSARTRLDLGQYSAVDEPLTYAEQAVGDEQDKLVEILLLRMKLAMRRNTYRVVHDIASRLEALVTTRPAAKLDGELILNVAYRDTLDADRILASCNRLLELRDAGTSEQRNAVDRALARSFAKLGKLDEALIHARAAVNSSSSLESIRSVGNAHLALGEVQRYRGDYHSATEEYRRAASIARAYGNRDSQLWALLGEAAAHIEAGTPDRASSPLGTVDALLREPGYEHPLETAHAALLRALARIDRPSLEDIASAYAPFEIKWPVEYYDCFLTSAIVRRPTPL